MKTRRLKKAQGKKYEQKALVVVDLMLHLFAKIEAAECSQRLLLDMREILKERNESGPRLETIHEFIPVVYLRQGQDEEAYRFIYERTNDDMYVNSLFYPEKLSAKAREDFRREPARKMMIEAELQRTAPLIVGANGWVTQEIIVPPDPCKCFEEIQQHASLGHQVTLTLMAIKALRFVQSFQHLDGLLGSYAGGNCIPQEMLDRIYEYMPDTESQFLQKLFGIDTVKARLDAKWSKEKILELKMLVTKCVFEAGCTNRHIWLWMLDTDRLAARDEFGQFYPAMKDHWNSKRMAELVAVRQYQAWMETPGAFSALRTAIWSATRWAEVRKFSWPVERQRRFKWDMPTHRLHYHEESLFQAWAVA